jgi:hypothetical protein
LLWDQDDNAARNLLKGHEAGDSWSLPVTGEQKKARNEKRKSVKAKKKQEREIQVD